MKQYRIRDSRQEIKTGWRIF